MGCRLVLYSAVARDRLLATHDLLRVQVLVWFLLLAHAGREEVEAAPSTRDRRESKSEAQQNFDPISLNDRKAHFGRNFPYYLLALYFYV